MALDKYRLRRQAPKGRIPFYEPHSQDRHEEPTEDGGFRVRRAGIGFHANKISGGFEIVAYRNCWDGWENAERAEDHIVRHAGTEKRARQVIGQHLGR